MKLWQVVILVVLATAMWALVTFNIARNPDAVLHRSGGPLNYAMAPIGGAISIWLCRFVARLSAAQLLPGVVIVGAVAMMIDAVAIRWFPAVYRSSDAALKLVGADLMWGYGVALAMAVLWAGWTHRHAA